MMLISYYYFNALVSPYGSANKNYKFQMEKLDLHGSFYSTFSRVASTKGVLKKFHSILESS